MRISLWNHRPQSVGQVEDSVVPPVPRQPAASLLARARSPGGLAPMQGPTGVGHNRPKELQPLEKDCARLEKAAPRAGGDRGPCVWPEAHSGRETATGRLVGPTRPQSLPLGRLPSSSSQDPALRGNVPSRKTDRLGSAERQVRRKMLCRKSSRGFVDGAAVQNGEGGWPGPEAPRRAAGSSLWADLEARPFVPWLGLPERPAG